MLKRYCICAGFAGALLVLAAVLMIAYYDHQQSSTHVNRQMRLVQAVGELDGCLTCHDATPQTAVVRMITPAQNEWLLDDLVRHTKVFPGTARTTMPPPIAPELEIELRAIGHRLLDLPTAQTQQATGVIDAYLAVYDAARAGEVIHNTAALLDSLAEIKTALRTLEYAAHRVRWESPHVPDSPPDRVLALSASGTPSPAVAWMVVEVLDPLAPAHIALDDASTIQVMPALAYALLRRGPPAAYVHDDICVLARRRLLVTL